ncbi:hypothetical protein L486_02681 [Kwoniella mangroviensis CBS 10435]|uniref:Uncharacterized protein n=1 Tax=Kwoniella mangroviensis CBS 10435 TaxID=1331196 RepID=A0A1B9IWW0_9TREE|nr:hypothetical protein L486_02681 [Kwoniella mangroviensis CBS 10435]
MGGILRDAPPSNTCEPFIPPDDQVDQVCFVNMTCANYICDYWHAGIARRNITLDHDGHYAERQFCYVPNGTLANERFVEAKREAGEEICPGNMTTFYKNSSATLRLRTGAGWEYGYGEEHGWKSRLWLWGMAWVMSVGVKLVVDGMGWGDL